MPRVFVPHEPTKLGADGFSRERTIDLSPAVDYGELTFVVPGGEIPLDPVAVLPAIRTVMRGFTSKDYLLPVGHPAVIAWCAIEAVRATGGPLNMLVWQRGRYVPFRADLS